MIDAVRQFVDRKNKENLPVQVVLVTDADMMKSLKDFARIPEDQVTGVLYASSLLPHKRLYEHDVFYDSTGKMTYLRMDTLATHKPGAHPISNEGLTNPTVQKAWFRLASSDWSVLTQIVAQTKKKGEIGDQSKLLFERAEAYLTTRLDAFDKRTLDLDAHVDGTKLVEQLACSPTHKVASKALAEKLKSAAKNDPLKSEIIARSVYFKLVPLQISLKKSENEAALGGYQQLASKYANTTYGRLAKVALGAMAAPAEK